MMLGGSLYKHTYQVGLFKLKNENPGPSKAEWQ